MITVACVWTGTKYGPEYVERLRNMAGRHLDRPHRVLCLTDRPEKIAGVDRINIAATGLTAWWAKMLLFVPSIRGPDRTLYFDLDTVICGDLGPLADLDCDFGICGNFARAAGHPAWPCAYGSCVMTFAPTWGRDVYDQFMMDREHIIDACGRYGDQMAIERLVPDATILQERLPHGFFLNKRDLGAVKPDSASVVVFGGAARPHNCTFGWVKEAWI